MSGNVTKDKSRTDKARTQELANAFQTIMGMRAGQKKPDKTAKDQYKVAKSALSPFLNKRDPKAISELEWYADDYREFSTLIGQMKEARGKSIIKGGADWEGSAQSTRIALQVAQAAMEKRAIRTRLSEDMQKARTVVSQLEQFDPAAAKEYRTKLSHALDGIEKGGTIAELNQLGDVIQDIKIEARQQEYAVRPRSTEVESTRTTLQVELNVLINKNDQRLGALAFATLPKGKIAFVEAEIRALTEPKVQPLRNTLLKAHDPQEKDGQPPLGDEQLIASLNDRAAAAKKAVDQVASSVETLIKDGSDKLLKTLFDGQEQYRKNLDVEKAQAQFLTDFAPVERGLAELRDIGAPEADILTRNAEKDKATMLESQAFRRGPVIIGVFLEEIAAAKRKAETAGSVEGEKLEGEIATLRKTVQKQAKMDSRVTPAFETLLTDLKQLGVVVETNNAGACASARQRMSEIAAASSGAAVKTLTQLLANADAISLVTSDATVAKEFESENNEILEAVQTAFKALDLYTVADTATSFAELRKQAAALEQKKDSLLTWREGTKERLKALDAMIKEFRGIVEDVRPTTFEVNVAVVKKEYGQPGVKQADIDKLLFEAERVVYPAINNLRDEKTRPRAIDALEQDFAKAGKQIEDEEKQADDQRNKQSALNGRILKFKTDLVKAGKAVKDDPIGDKEKLKELRELFRQVEETRKKDEDAADKKLKLIEPQMEQLLKYPGGVTAESVEKLKDIAAMWKNAIDKTESELDVIGQAAVAVAPAARVAPDVITGRVAKILARLRPFERSLVQSVLVLHQGENGTVGQEEHAKILKARKAAREAALKDLRSLKNILDGDPAIAQLDSNPFVGTSPLADMRRFVAEAEYNVLRAVPTT